MSVFFGFFVFYIGFLHCVLGIASPAYLVLIPFFGVTGIILSHTKPRRIINAPAAAPVTESKADTSSPAEIDFPRFSSSPVAVNRTIPSFKGFWEAKTKPDWEPVRRAIPLFVRPEGGLISARPNPRRVLERELNADEIRALAVEVRAGNPAGREALIALHYYLLSDNAGVLIRANRDLRLSRKELYAVGTHGYGVHYSGLVRFVELVYPL